MSINSGEAFGIEEFGLSMNDEDGNNILYITGGVGSPVGQQAPVPTLYVSNIGEVWRKTGVAVNDWELLKVIDFNLDGGFANSIYTPDECVDGGDANG